jgi:hypothetical protein
MLSIDANYESHWEWFLMFVIFSTAIMKKEKVFDSRRSPPMGMLAVETNG